MKPPKILIRIGVVLMVVVAVVLAARAFFNYTEGRKLARALADLKEKGVPLAARDLTPPCPDGDNAARLWKAIENLMTTDERELEPRRDGEKARAPLPSPLQGLLSRAWTDFSNGKPVASADKVGLQNLIRRNNKTFEVLAEMGLKPCFRYRDPEDTLLETRLPSALKMIRLTRLLVFAALFSAEEGDAPAAVDKVRLGLRFAPLVAQEGSLMPCLIAFSDTRVLTYYLGDILRGRNVGDDALLQLIDELDPGPWLARLAGAIRGERVVFIEAAESALQGRLNGLDFLFGKPRFLKNLGLWLVRPLLKKDIRRSLPVFQELEEKARLPYYASRAFLRSQDQERKRRPWYAFLSKAMISDFEAAFMKEAQVEAVLLASRTGLACRLYKSRTGAYPDSLEALLPGILKEVPIDPFTGKPFVYRREGQGFIVYSLGSNEKDDGGRSTYMITQLVMDKDDDWTWKEDR